MIVDPAFQTLRVVVVLDPGQVVLFPIEIGSESPRHFDRVIVEFHIDLIQSCRVPFDRRIDEDTCGQIVEDTVHRFDAIFFNQKLDQQRGLQIGKLQVFGFFRTQERTAHFANR